MSEFGEFSIGDRSMTFETYEVNQELLAALLGDPTPPPASLTVKTRGKRYWWKPWRRRPDRIGYFPAATFDPHLTESGEMGFTARLAGSPPENPGTPHHSE